MGHFKSKIIIVSHLKIIKKNFRYFFYGIREVKIWSEGIVHHYSLLLVYMVRYLSLIFVVFFKQKKRRKYIELLIYLFLYFMDQIKKNEYSRVEINNIRLLYVHQTFGTIL